MNFQGPRDYTPYIRRYQEVVTLLLLIQKDYPDVYKQLLLSPQFEYEFEACRFKKKWAEIYLRKLRKLVYDYDRAVHSETYRMFLLEEPVALLEWRRF